MSPSPKVILKQAVESLSSHCLYLNTRQKVKVGMLCLQ